jgi:transmembrane secretion effector
VVTFLSGIATLLFDLAAQAYLPVLILHQDLVEGNAKLETSRSAATIAGPAFAGALIQGMGAPFAIIFDALTFFASALLLIGMRQKELIAPKITRGIWPDILEGIQILWSNQILRTVFRTAILWNLFINVMQAVLILFATRELQMSTSQLGFLFSTLGIGMSVGAALAGSLRKRFGVGNVLIGSGFFAASSGLLTLLSGVLGQKAGFPLIMVAQFIFGMGPMIFGINALSLRQAVTPNHMQGRVNATYRFGAWGTLPLGAMLGGVIGERFGLLAAIGVAACGMFVAVALLLLSPLSTLHDLPVFSDVTSDQGLLLERP